MKVGDIRKAPPIVEFDGLPAHMRTDANAYRYIRKRMIQFPARSTAPAGPSPSWTERRERRCYHHPNGVFRCPVGWLISRDVYKAKVPTAWRVNPSRDDTWERIIDHDLGEHVLTPHVQQAVRLSWGSLPDLGMLCELQELHDNYLPVSWGAQLDAIGAFRRYL